MEGSRILSGSRLIIPLVAALLWVAVPADAGNGKAACPTGSGCVWTEHDFEGSRTEVPSTGCLDSKIRSAVNTSDAVLVLYYGGGCQGPRAGELDPGQEYSRIDARSATGDCSQDTVDPCGGETVPPPSAPSSCGSGLEPVREEKSLFGVMPRFAARS